MTNIIVNADNLSRFNKRLQKAIKKDLQIDVNLAQSSNLFAQSLGVSNEFELKKLLDKHTTESFTDVLDKFSKYEKEVVNHFNFHIQELLNKSPAEFFFYNFYSDIEGFYPSMSGLGFSKEIQVETDFDILDKVAGTSHYGLLDFTIDKHVISSPNKYQSDIMDILSSDKNFKACSSILDFYHEHILRLMPLIEVEKTTVIYRDKILIASNIFI